MAWLSWLSYPIRVLGYPHHRDDCKRTHYYSVSASLPYYAVLTFCAQGTSIQSALCARRQRKKWRKWIRHT